MPLAIRRDGDPDKIVMRNDKIRDNGHVRLTADSSSSIVHQKYFLLLVFGFRRHSTQIDRPHEMPIPIIAHGIQEGIDTIPYAWSVIKTAPWILLLAALKYYFGGARNTSERLMHSKVVMVTVRT